LQRTFILFFFNDKSSFPLSFVVFENTKQTLVNTQLLLHYKYISYVFLCNECKQRSFVCTTNINFISIYITYMPIYGITHVLGKVQLCAYIWKIGETLRHLLSRSQHWLTLLQFLHPGGNPVMLLRLMELLNCNLPSVNTISLVALWLLLLVLLLAHRIINLRLFVSLRHITTTL